MVSFREILRYPAEVRERNKIRPWLSKTRTRNGISMLDVRTASGDASVLSRGDRETLFADTVISLSEDAATRAVRHLAALGSELGTLRAEIAFLLSRLVPFFTDGSKLGPEILGTAAALLRDWFESVNTSEWHVVLPADVYAVSEAAIANRVLKAIPSDVVSSLLKTVQSGLPEVLADWSDDLKAFEGVPVICCPHCNCKVSTIGSVCKRCAFPLMPMYLPYQRMTDFVVWPWVVRTAGIDPAVNCDINIALKAARSYKCELDIGIEDMKLQLYFAAHMVLIVTGYGQNTVQSGLMQEYILVANTLPLVAEVYRDAELLGELLFVAQLFDFSGLDVDQREKLCAVVGSKEQVENRLVNCRAVVLSQEVGGQWHGDASGRGIQYDSFHRSYCALMGLIVVPPGPPVVLAPYKTTRSENRITTEDLEEWILGDEDLDNVLYKKNCPRRVIPRADGRMAIMEDMSGSVFLDSREVAEVVGCEHWKLLAPLIGILGSLVVGKEEGGSNCALISRMQWAWIRSTHSTIGPLAFVELEHVDQRLGRRATPRSGSDIQLVGVVQPGFTSHSTKTHPSLGRTEELPRGSRRITGDDIRYSYALDAWLIAARPGHRLKYAERGYRTR